MKKVPNMDEDGIKVELDVEDHGVQAAAGTSREKQRQDIFEPFSHVFIKMEKLDEADSQPGVGTYVRIKQELAVDSGSDIEYDSDPECYYGFIDYEMYGTNHDDDDSNSDSDEYQLDGEELSWSKDFKTFANREEPFTRVTGPVNKDSTPLGIFDAFWDRDIIKLMVRETNTYAAQKLSAQGDALAIAQWKETDVDEMYVFLALIVLTNCVGTGYFEEYWTGFFMVRIFPEVMPGSRFQEILKYFHFVNNETLGGTHSFLRKIGKIQSIIDHCNDKFKYLYVPKKHLTIQESILFWMGTMSINRSIACNFTRSGIKAYELVESDTGYMLQFKIYTCEKEFDYQEPLTGYNRIPSKMVLKLVQDFLDQGHCLVVNNLYNDVGLARQLKSRKTDFIGPLNRRRANVSTGLKKLKPPQLATNSVVTQHCGDVSVIAWKRQNEIMTMVSTFQGSDNSPKQIYQDYLKYKGTDKTEEKLVYHLRQKDMRLKWYIQEFRRLLKCSLANCFVVYNNLNSSDATRLSKTDFQCDIAKGIIERHWRRNECVCQAPHRFEETKENTSNNKQGKKKAVATKRKHCVRCADMRFKIFPS